MDVELSVSSAQGKSEVREALARQGYRTSPGGVRLAHPFSIVVQDVAPDAVAALTRTVLADGVTPAALSLQRALTDAERSMSPTYPSSAKAVVNERGEVGLGLESRWRPAAVDPQLARRVARDLDQLI